LNQAIRVGPAEQIRVRRRHVQPGGETREARAVTLHLRDGARRYHLRTQHAEQIDKTHQEVFDAFFLGNLFEIRGHWERSRLS